MPPHLSVKGVQSIATHPVEEAELTDTFIQRNPQGTGALSIPKANIPWVKPRKNQTEVGAEGSMVKAVSIPY